MNNTATNGNEKATEILGRMFAAEMQTVQSGGTDTSGMAHAFHPDIVVHEPTSLPYAGEWRGHDGLKELFVRMHELWKEMDVKDMHATVEGDTLFMHCTFTATARQSGQKVSQPFAEVLMLKNDLVIEGFPFYHDTAAINKAISHMPIGK